ncbi:ABC transporter ATP-binding protein [Pseudokineococcus marinus]|uniref:ABC transporter ATP-binding protein n=1 Tax=Pseudokineococcus marinus TaxID=351215 RepID=A0A849BKG9_9ACTN|nr:ABC transporter ATP-binding protein [Pseudokineococcus marinus]NNH23779.1 ABC transporter ATP-binding protein [Pseudokineococcus marinus]
MTATAAAAPAATRTDAPLLRVRGLRVEVDGHGAGAEPVELVRGVDLDVERGELVALLGESGSGKSVTARAVLGLDAPGMRRTAEDLSLAGLDLRGLSERELRPLRGARMALVVQDALSALNPVLTVGDQIGELVRVHTGASRRAARARAVELLGLVGIPGAAQRVRDHPHQFSGGMRQRILIAMAVALEPELLVADEPTTALDVTVQAQVLELLDGLRRELGMGVLLITHDLGVVSEVADRVAVMYAGRVVESGHADDVLLAPAHPYTRALLASVPQPVRAAGGLATIPGSPPVPAQTPPGCAFHPRCAWAVDRCATEVPAPRAPGPPPPTGVPRTSACLRAEEVLRGR